MRVEDQAAFVLRTQSYLETSLLVDIFSLEYGRLKLVAKGARGGRASKASKLQLFSELTIGWQGKSDLKTLTRIDSGAALLSRPERLVAGMYLNELLFFLLTEMDPHPDLYRNYLQTLSLLDSSPSLEPVLRNFELGLLEELGYAVNLFEDIDGQPLSAEQTYLYYADSGFSKANGQPGAIPGEAIIQLANQGLSTELSLRVAKVICRSHIDSLLNGRELQSRKWYLNSASRFQE